MHNFLSLTFYKLIRVVWAKQISDLMLMSCIFIYIALIPGLNVFIFMSQE